MSTLSQFGFGGGIKSIQTITQTQNTNRVAFRRNSSTWRKQAQDSEDETHIDITIDPVDPNKTILITDLNVSGAVMRGEYLGGSVYQYGDFRPVTGLHYAELIDSTTLRIKGPTILTDLDDYSIPAIAAIPATMRVQIVEFN